jgi:two-component system cell cycle sensor histidine kinase/response regulator CckA
VKQSGGFIFAEWRRRMGFRRAPVYGLSAGASWRGGSGAPASVTAWAGGGDILLVEDEDSVRVVAERALTRAGYQVTTAMAKRAGAGEARRESGAAMFDLVLSDVVMPAWTGPPWRVRCADCA